MNSGGGICCQYYSNPAIINNTVYGNWAAGPGDGISCIEYSNPIIVNTIFWGNEGSQVDYDGSSSPIFSYCDVQGGWAGEGNIDIDPLFRDPENGDFHLMADSCGDVYNSPCIDAGDPAIFDSMHGCDWGLGELRSDMGAYGGGDSVQVGIDDQNVVFPKQFALAQNFPNPFNASTIIRYSLLSPSNVTIDIYDILGRRVERLVQEEQPAGYHQVVWDGKDKNGKTVSTGIYFYELYNDNYRESKAMIMIK